MKNVHVVYLKQNMAVVGAVHPYRGGAGWRVVRGGDDHTTLVMIAHLRSIRVLPGLSQSEAALAVMSWHDHGFKATQDEKKGTVLHSMVKNYLYYKKEI